MAIQTLELTDFTAFKRATLSLSPGINVFIGENATGKTHAMKALYAMLRWLAGDEEEAEERRIVLAATKLVAVFRPDDDDFGRLRRWGTDESSFTIRAGRGSLVRFAQTSNEAELEIPGNWHGPSRICYLPAREVLALYEGFIATYRGSQISFDETIYDACVALQGPLLHRVPDALVPVLAHIERLLEGSVVLRGNRFYVRRGEHDIEAHLLAEGLRKIAGLARLIANGAIAPHGLLIWDEPEGNLNPMLTVQVADVLLDLAAAGVQVIVSSHDYLFVRRLSLIAEYKKRPDVPIRFFGLSPSKAGVTVETGNVLADLAHNPILDEFTRQADFEQALFYGTH